VASNGSSSASVEAKPPVALVVPVKDEEDSLSELWASVCRQTVAPSEIVFVEAGSSDRSPAILDQISAEDSRVRVVAAPGAYPGTARNLGIEAASHSIVALTDCGTVLSRKWLEELLRAFKAYEGCDVAYGSFEPIHDRPTAAWGTIAFLPPLGRRDGGLPRGETLRSLLLTKEIWARAGRFPPWRAAEDLDFLDRLRKSSAQPALAPKAVAYWRAPRSLSEMFRKLSVYSRHNVWAGQQRGWHFGVARVYGAAFGAGVLTSVATGRRPGHAISASLLTSLAARTVDRLWRARLTDPPLRAVRTGDAMGVALMILVGDAATIFGWLQALVRRRPSVYSS
jgi:cellulose synthase/poly-beta-1,6-N-acetylglucosamine synthase-like glycosyltransferase